jgi:hyperosmotically inducible periplasmic protein
VILLVLLLAGCSAATRGIGDDLSTTTQVKIALLTDAALGSQRLEVQTVQGAVILSGTVKSEADAQHAVAIARKVQGVRRVTSELKIEPQ